MARVHEIAVGADGKAFDEGVRKGVIKPIEDAERALRDLGDDRSLDRLDDKMSDAQRQTKRLEDAIEDVGSNGKRDLRKLGDAAGDAKKDLGKITEGAEEVRKEFATNFGETVSSFSGDLSDLGEMGQGVLGGLAATAMEMGPAGIVAGAGLGVVAAAVGGLSEHWQHLAEVQEEARESAFSYAYDVAGALEAAGYTERIQGWTSDTEKWKQAQDIATAAGWDVYDVVDALAKGGPDLDNLTTSMQENAMSTMVTNNRLRELDEVLKGTKDGFAMGADAAKIAARAKYEYAMSVGKATGETDALGNAIYELPDGKTLVVDAQTQQAHEDLAAVEAQRFNPKTVRVVADVSAAKAEIDRLVRNGAVIPARLQMIAFNGSRSIP